MLLSILWSIFQHLKVAYEKQGELLFTQAGGHRTNGNSSNEKRRDLD